MIRTSSGRLVNQSVSFLKQVVACQSIKQPRRRRSTVQNTQREERDKLWYHTPTEGFVRLSPYDPITCFPDTTLDQFLWANIHKWEAKTAAVCIVSGRQYTFAQMRDRCAALAVRLQQKLKLQPRDVIAVCLPNLPEYPIAAFGSIEAGLTVTTVNPSYTADEIGRQLVNSNAKCIIGKADNFDVLKKACEIAQKNIPIICIRTTKSDALPKGSIDFFEFIDPKGVTFSDLKPTGITKNDIVFLPYSSGTTGLPKGVILTHENITVNCKMVEANSPYQSLIQETTDNHQDVLPCVLPFFHIYGLTVCMISMLHQGCKLVTLPKFTPDDLIKSLDDYKGTVLNLVPPIALFLTNSDKINVKQADKLRVVISGAAPIGALDVERFLAKFPHVNFLQGYGLTETSPVCLLTPMGSKKYASAGFVVANNKARIIAFDAKDPIGLGPNQSGELCFQGAHIMREYLNNEEATRNTFYPDRWYRTGDIGYYDEEGYFFITDRMKELIKVKGFQVPPAELEELLRDHPKILDAAVIGIPDHKCGELPRAFVVLRKGSVSTEDEIKEYIAGKVIEYKRLEGGVIFLDEIPKTASGKILRKELKSKYS